MTTWWLDRELPNNRYVFRDCAPEVIRPLPEIAELEMDRRAISEQICDCDGLAKAAFWNSIRSKMTGDMSFSASPYEDRTPGSSTTVRREFVRSSAEMSAACNRSDIASISVFYTPSEADWSSLLRCTTLSSLEIWAPLPERQLMHIASMQQLGSLALFRVGRISKRVARQLAMLSELEVFSVVSCGIDNGFETALAGMPKLRILRVEDAGIQDSVVLGLVQPQKLEILDLSVTAVSDSVLDRCEKWESLYHVAFTCTSVGDDLASSAFKRCPGLRYLGVADTRVSGSTFDEAMRMGVSVNIDVRNSEVSLEALMACAKGPLCERIEV